MRNSAESREKVREHPDQIRFVQGLRSMWGEESDSMHDLEEREKLKSTYYKH